MIEEKVQSLIDADAFPGWKEIMAQNPDYIGIWSLFNYGFPIKNAFAVFVEKRENNLVSVTHETRHKEGNKEPNLIQTILRLKPASTAFITEEEKGVDRIRGRIEDRLGSATFYGFEVPEVSILFYKVYNPEGLAKNAIKHPLIYDGTIAHSNLNSKEITYYRGEYTMLSRILLYDMLGKFEENNPFLDNSSGMFRLHPLNR